MARRWSLPTAGIDLWHAVGRVSALAVQHDLCVRSTLLAINVDADCSFPISQVREIDRLQASENQDASGFARSELSQAASFAPACGPNWASAFADVSSVMH